MARVPYVVNDALGEICVALEISGWTRIGGHYTFSDYDTTYNAVTEMLDAMYEDEDETNDAVADRYYAMLDNTDYTVMYWSTEKGAWV